MDFQTRRSLILDAAKPDPMTAEFIAYAEGMKAKADAALRELKAGRVGSDCRELIGTAIRTGQEDFYRHFYK